MTKLFKQTMVAIVSADEIVIIAHRHTHISRILRGNTLILELFSQGSCHKDEQTWLFKGNFDEWMCL